MNGQTSNEGERPEGGMNKPLRILHLEDNPTDAELVLALLEQEELDVTIHRVETRHDFERALTESQFDIIISDYSLPSFDGRSALRTARARYPDIPFIFVSGTLGEEAAVDSLQNGAIDYILKDRLPRLAAAVKRAIRETEQRQERRRMEAELLQRDELFRGITESVTDHIAVLDLQGKPVFHSPSYMALARDPSARESSDSFADIHPVDRERIRALFQETAVSGNGYRADYRLVLANAQICYLETQASAIRDGHGAITHVLVVSRDVTARKTAEQALIAAEARFRNLVEQSIVGICILQDGRVLYANPKIAQILGYQPHELVSRALLELVTDEGKAQAALVIGPDARREAPDMSTEFRMKRKDGQIICVDAHACQTEYRGKAATIGTLLDITEKKDLEAKLLRTQRLESIGALAGGVAHDLNNMLTPIFMATELLRTGLEAEEVPKMLETIHQSASRGSELVKQILSFARGVAGEPSLLQLDHIVTDLAKLITGTFPRSIRIRTLLRRPLQPVLGDATQVHQVLLNLCLNGRDAMPDGGTLTIEAANVRLQGKVSRLQPSPLSGDFVGLTVSDTGTGIPPELLDRIFEPFFSTKAPGKGTGLGLSTVAGIVKDHGGTLEVISQVGEGSRFVLYLPTAVSGQPDAIGKTLPDLPAGQGEQILLIDDERAVLEMTKGTLESFGYTVLMANHGAEAMVLYTQFHKTIAAVITDLMMPVMDGPALIRWLHQQDPSVRIICTSGLASERKLAEFDRSQARALLPKPYTTAQLLTTLHRVLDRMGTRADGENPAN